MTRKIAWVTGASTGIGAATTKRLVQDGWTVIATARSQDKLNALVEECGRLPGIVMAYEGDVTDLARMKEIVTQVEKSIGTIYLALLNAGTYKADPLPTFTAANFSEQMSVNLIGVANCVEALRDSMIANRAGHIAIVASVAGYRGLPRSLSYGPTKAALINMAEALAIEGREFNIKVQVVNPGFIRTPLTDKNDFPMPFLMDVDKAADSLVKGLASSRFEITFPLIFSMLLKFIGLLPPRLYQKVVGSSTKRA
jgi:short-subunit dehydrogenase